MTFSAPSCNHQFNTITASFDCHSKLTYIIWVSRNLQVTACITLTMIKRISKILNFAAFIYVPRWALSKLPCNHYKRLHIAIVGNPTQSLTWSHKWILQVFLYEFSFLVDNHALPANNGQQRQRQVDGGKFYIYVFGQNITAYATIKVHVYSHNNSPSFSQTDNGKTNVHSYKISNASKPVHTTNDLYKWFSPSVHRNDDVMDSQLRVIMVIGLTNVILVGKYWVTDLGV
jgi:hypothetical protein